MIEAYKIALLQPVKITSDFGKRKDPVTGKEQVTHAGMDLISGNKNNKREVFAVADGVVLSTVTNQSNAKTGYGNRIWIRHKDLGWSSFYAHLEKVNVKKGDVIKQGQIIGIEGSTGKSTGIHLHFGIQYIGSSVWQDPKKFKVPYIQVTPTVKRDETKDQIKVITTQLRVRKDHNTNAGIIGVAKKDGIYNYYGTYKDSKYTWYKIADSQWVANDGTWLEIYPKKGDNMDELKKQLEEANKKINELTLRVAEQDGKISNLETINNALQEENNSLLKDIESYKEIYKCTKDGNYKIKVKLYENECLYIK